MNEPVHTHHCARCGESFNTRSAGLLPPDWQWHGSKLFCGACTGAEAAPFVSSPKQVAVKPGPGARGFAAYYPPAHRQDTGQIVFHFSQGEVAFSLDEACHLREQLDNALRTATHSIAAGRGGRAGRVELAA